MLFGDKASKIDKLVGKRNSAKLVALIKDKNPDIRIKAIKALGQIGDDTSINNLTILLHDQDKVSRKAAIESMGETGNAVAKTHLQYYIEKEDDQELVKAARSSIAKISDVITPRDEALIS
ncbi:MAG: HEAT repeat domain-containing protein [Clostridia bacterium]|nr:HEAT repeat domain-containing protein [Clostridia bacterium]